jgi:predicted enzyme related to lactoylglutathione lyase
MSKNPVVHFEMPYNDQGRVSAFYEKAFGWKMNVMGPDMGGYVVAHTAEADANNMITQTGAINGGFFPKKADLPAQHPSVVIAVEDIQTAMGQVKEAGGEVLGEPIEIPGIGLYVSFNDTEDNRVSLLQPHKP